MGHSASASSSPSGSSTPVHNAVRTRLNQLSGGLGHLGKLIAVVAEITESGPQQGAHRQAGLGLDLPHQRKAGRGAANDQVGAQLQPVGSAPLCRKALATLSTQTSKV